MTRALYQGYLKLCKSWGTDTRKSGRDLGVYIRDKVASEFKEADLTIIKNPVECQAKLDSLQRLANNTYYQESDANIIPSTGLTRKEIEEWTSSDMLQASKDLAESPKMQQLRVAFEFYKKKYWKKNKDNIVVVNPHDDTKKLPETEDTTTDEGVIRGQSEDKK